MPGLNVDQKSNLTSVLDYGTILKTRLKLYFDLGVNRKLTLASQQFSKLDSDSILTP